MPTLGGWDGGGGGHVGLTVLGGTSCPPGVPCRARSGVIRGRRGGGQDRTELGSRAEPRQEVTRSHLRISARRPGGSSRPDLEQEAALGEAPSACRGNQIRAARRKSRGIFGCWPGGGGGAGGEPGGFRTPSQVFTGGRGGAASAGSGRHGTDEVIVLKATPFL